MLQVMLCAICMMSAALLYYDFVIIPRQNRELVEDLKSHFPEVSITLALPSLLSKKAL